MPIKAIIFDLDNTLYPASSGLMSHMSERISGFMQEALSMDQAAARDLCKHYYGTYGATVHGLRKHHTHIDPEAYLAYVHDIAIDQFVQPHAELDALLDSLPLRKIIFTNSVQPYAGRVLDCLGIAHHFEHLFDLRYFNFEAKPNPSAYQHVLDQLGLHGPETIMVEDTLSNLPPAATLGMVTILVDEDLTTTAGADYIVPNIISALRVAQELINTPKQASVNTKRRRMATKMQKKAA